MRLRLSQDARPQAMTLLIAATISIVLSFIPYAEFLTYPFRIFVTFIHEGGHALAALVTGNSVASLSVAMNASVAMRVWVCSTSGQTRTMPAKTPAARVHRAT